MEAKLHAFSTPEVAEGEKPILYPAACVPTARNRGWQTATQWSYAARHKIYDLASARIANVFCN
jgi:hypothetical protein